MSGIKKSAMGVLAALVTCGSASLAGAGVEQKRWVSGQVLVEPNAGIDAESFANLLHGHGVRSRGAIGSLNVHIVEVPPQAEAAVAEALSHNPKIKFAEVDMLLAPTATTANDTYYPDAWHLNAINAPLAWDASTGDGVTVAVLDTGVDDAHPDLQGQLVAGWNTYNNNANTSPVCGHGTKVAGAVAAASNNGMGVTSIAWNTKIMPMMVTGTDCYASASALAGALTWAADHGARVANMSFEGVSGSSTVTSGARYMRSRGGVVLAAAGNSGTDSPVAPNPDMLVVSATNSNDVVTNYSNYGDFVDVAAPGNGIWTTTTGGGYAAFSGTSAATPVTSGVVALVMAANPSLSPDQVESVLESSALDLGSPGKDPYFGYGRVDAAAAVAAAGTDGGTVPADTVAPLVAITSPNGGTVSGMVNVAVSASDDTGVDRVSLFVNGQLLDTDFSAPYSFAWDTSSYAGPVNLVAQAFDAANNAATSNGVNVTVEEILAVDDTTPPTVSILSPVSSSVLSGTVQIEVSADDNVGVALVQCFVDGKLKAVTTSSALTCSWNTRKETAGAHTIEARAEDAAGNKASSSLVVEVGRTAKGGGGGGGGGKGRKK